jgi:hypothetical protein
MPEGKFFYIRSQLSDKVLDIRGSSSDPGTTVCLWDEHGGDNQLWYVDHVKGVIRSKLNDMVLEVNADNRLQINDYNEAVNFNQVFCLGEERIQHRHFRDRVFDVCGSNEDNGAEVCTWEWHEGDNQKWQFDYQEPSYFFIVSQMNEKVIDVAGGDYSENSKIIVWEKHGGDNQQWYEDKNGVVRSKVGDFAMSLAKEPGKAVRLENFKVGLPRTMWGISDETLVNFARPDICLDIKNREDSDGAKVIAWEYHGRENQKWNIEYAE